VDEDTRAFTKIMDAFSLSAGSEEEKLIRKNAVQEATLDAIEIPLKVMRASMETMEVIKRMAETGNPNSVSDAGVAALCARSAVLGAGLNVKINCKGYEDEKYVAGCLKEYEDLKNKAIELEKLILDIVEKKIGI
jgi:glutamate formiminotransferase/formiminotetrahydrofolate cyclodeaminase